MNKTETQVDLKNGNENSHKNNDVIDLVGEIFNKISNNQAIPHTISIELAKLQTPYLKIALETPNLFRLENHQARLFLEAIVKITKEQNSINPITASYTKKINSIVEQITNSEKYDSKLYIKLENDLGRFIKRQVKRAEVKKKREKEKLKGLKKIKLAKTNAKQLLQNRVANKKLPKFVQKILVNEWLNVLVLKYLRHDSESQHLQESISFIDELVKYTYSESDSVASNSQLLSLSKQYKEGLELVAFNPSDSDSKSQGFLKSMSVFANSKTSTKEKENTSKIINPKDIIKLSNINKQKKTQSINQTTQIAVEVKNNSIKEVNVDYAKLIDSFQEGDWFDISTTDNKIVKSKLSWISPITGKFLFVDINGLKITDETKVGLEYALQDQTIKILSNK